MTEKHFKYVLSVPHTVVITNTSSTSVKTGNIPMKSSPWVGSFLNALVIRHADQSRV